MYKGLSVKHLLKSIFLLFFICSISITPAIAKPYVPMKILSITYTPVINVPGMYAYCANLITTRDGLERVEAYPVGSKTRNIPMTLSSGAVVLQTGHTVYNFTPTEKYEIAHSCQSVRKNTGIKMIRYTLESLGFAKKYVYSMVNFDNLNPVCKANSKFSRKTPSLSKYRLSLRRNYVTPNGDRYALRTTVANRTTQPINFKYTVEQRGPNGEWIALVSGARKIEPSDRSFHIYSDIPKLQYATELRIHIRKKYEGWMKEENHFQTFCMDLI